MKLKKVNDQEYSLEIDEVETSDAGSYRVVFSTETESLESSSEVQVLEQVKFKKSLTDTSVVEGSTAEMEVNNFSLSLLRSCKSFYGIFFVTFYE